ncbi:MAG: class I SAM-dependent methyltransferase [Pseudomonadota bacterium]|uniref:class I SAM-dependent methyltransferase n=1 Tax=Sphingomonas sp. ERG5 TaxID=1381597 RepID=UPI00068A2260|nr:class I SAM-dependent methyltransferase [Sphingomonas sp. ERG5]
MMQDEHYAPASVWDAKFRAILAVGEPDQSRQWLDPFLPLLAERGCHQVLDLGCGTGYDALALARRGFAVEGIDYSQVAIDEALRMATEAALAVGFRQGDIGAHLPYADHSFDAVISNLVLHSFADAELRRVIAEVDRCLRPGGLFAFHANSTEDRDLRVAFQPPERQLGPRSYVLAGGQTMHFLTRENCETLLAEWEPILLEPATSLDGEGRPIKHVWRCAVGKRH